MKYIHLTEELAEVLDKWLTAIQKNQSYALIHNPLSKETINNLKLLGFKLYEQKEDTKARGIHYTMFKQI
jgi:sulfur transfer complex TusBCD TusB component (DsrH family)